MEIVHGNYTLVTEFILFGFTTCPALQIVLFLVFLRLHSVILVGNIGLMLLIRTDPNLQSPMYFFPQQPVLCRQLLLLSQHPQNAGQFLSREQVYLLLWVHRAVTLFLCLCRHWILYPGYPGLWQLCLYL